MRSGDPAEAQFWREVEEAFSAVLASEDEGRAAALEAHCAGNPALRDQVEALLAAHARADGFITPMTAPALVEPPAAPSEPDPHIGRTLSHYEIQGVISEGGMGTVYRALDVKLGREVALKLLPPSLVADPERRRRFEQEARAAATLEHPHLAAVYEIGEAEGISFIAMELIRGETLTALLGRGRMKPVRALELAIEVAEGLARAHERGIVHRDLKPGNIMLTADDHAKIIDFGLVKLTQPAGATSTTRTATEAGKVMGTVAYMSPEQARGAPVDHRSDIFSFGIVLHEMLAGTRPFRGQSDLDTLHAILHSPPPRLTTTPDAPDVQRILDKCLAKDPQDRYQAMKDLIVDLHAAWLRLESGSGPGGAPLEPLTIGPLGLAASRGLRLRPSWLAGMALLALAIAASSLFLWHAARTARTAKGGKPARIVVLPFQNLGAPEDAYFAAGLTEEVITRLANLQGLSVISRTTAFGYDRKGKTIRQIANDLGVDFVLEGSLRWDRGPGRESRVRITPALSQVADDTQVWADIYDRRLVDLFAIQSEVAENVVRAMGVKLVPREKTALTAVFTKDMEAYDFYLRGLEVDNRSMTKEDLEGAVRLFQAAVDRDPRFTQALARLARAHAGLYFYHWDRNPEHVHRAKDAVDRLAALGPDLAETHIALGYYHYWALGDYPRGLGEFRAALLLQPSGNDARDGISYILRRQGRWQESAEESAKVLEIDPRNPPALFEHGLTCILLRRYAEADHALALAASFDPQFVDAWAWRVWVQLLWHGDVEKAHSLVSETTKVPRFNDSSGRLAYEAIRIALIRRDFQGALRLLDGEKRDALFTQWFYRPIDLLRGEAQRLSGENDLARVSFEASRRRLQELIAKDPDDSRYHSALGIACAGLGLREEALRAAKRGIELMPPSRDPWRAMWRIEDQALVHTMLGQQNEAIDRLDFLLSRTGEMSTHLLRLDPRWETLKSTPRFQALLTKYGDQP